MISKKPLFTTKHYKAIAKLIKSELDDARKFDDVEVDTIWYLVDKVCHKFSKDNPKFKEKEFRRSLVY